MVETDNIIGTTKRLDWIDALKGFAIFCVTVGHCDLWFPIEQYIYSFHMFLFFFISGFLFSTKGGTKIMLAKCTKRILLPFIVWNIISSLSGYIFSNDLPNMLEELFVIEGNLTWNAPIWFLLVLYITEVIFILLRLHKRVWISVATIVVSLVLWVLIGHQWLLWKLNLVPMALVFFLSGYLCKPLIPILKEWYILLIAGIGSLIFSMLNIRVIYTVGWFGNYSYCIIAAFCGVIFFVGLFARVRFFSRLQFLINWGKNSLLIMALQFPIFRAISSVSIKFFSFDLMQNNNSLVSLAIAVFTIVTISLLTAFLKKITGGKKSLRAIGETFGIQYLKEARIPKHYQQADAERVSESTQNHNEPDLYKTDEIINTQVYNNEE